MTSRFFTLRASILIVALWRQRFVRMDGGLSSLDKEGDIYMVLNDSLKLDDKELRILAAILQKPDVAPRIISLDLRCNYCSTFSDFVLVLHHFIIPSTNLGATCNPPARRFQ